MSLLTALDREHTTAPAGYSRWLIPPAALSVHLCIGQVYSTSVYKNSFIAHFDASQTAIGIIFSIAIVMLGLSAAVGGTWVEKNGPRKAMFVSACFWALGFLVGALGIATQQLWLLYLGYGVLGGIGLGIGYISPVSTLIKWFPDRPGLATGMAIMGFGGGALLASPASRQLLSFYDSGYDPTVATSVASGHALLLLFLTLGAAYFVIMMFGVATIRVPAPGWRPEGWDPSTVKSKPMITTAHVSAANAVKTRSFWLLWIVLFCNVTAGIGILEQASPMIQDFFRENGTSAVAVAAAGGFVGLLSLFNMGGRFVWSSTSDIIGRKPIYMIYLGAGMVMYLLLATVGSNAIPLFVLLAGVILSFYGGGFATIPAYLRDLFGTFQVGAIHGRLLTAWSAAGIAGPLIVNGFLDSQGKPGTLTASAYQPALLTMVGVLAIGFIANLLVKPVPSKFHEPTGPLPTAAPEAAPVAEPEPETAKAEAEAEVIEAKPEPVADAEVAKPEAAETETETAVAVAEPETVEAEVAEPEAEVAEAAEVKPEAEVEPKAPEAAVAEAEPKADAETEAEKKKETPA
ncbi:OFA family MFS transporter [Actinoplanes rectilineatus]|uniref:OFA family MFS transporter n=1 Tax=Actinoplanes rectilineatus TaxID=113571 RepID=UPI000A7E4FC2|nr:OFA family MFS transporter [Actinoplanes rectilineatus]